VARDFPLLRFAIIDMVVDLPNVQSFVYREHEGAFLVGMLAALASTLKRVDLAVLQAFRGVQPGITVLGLTVIDSSVTGQCR